MTRDALEPRARRIDAPRFSETSGALIVAFPGTPKRHGREGGSLPHRKANSAHDASHIDPAKLDSWIAITPTAVTAYTGKCELGRGSSRRRCSWWPRALGPAPPPADPVRHRRLAQLRGRVRESSTPTNFNERISRRPPRRAGGAVCGPRLSRLGVPVDQLSVRPTA